MSYDLPTFDLVAIEAEAGEETRKAIQNIRLLLARLTAIAQRVGTEDDPTGGITDLTGDVTATGPGSAAATIANNAVTTAKILNGAVTEAKITLADNTTNNVTSTKHGFAPKSPADATKFLNGAATPAYAAVKDSDLSTSDITTNDVSTSKHGFAPKGDGSTSRFLNANGEYSTPSGTATLWTEVVAQSDQDIDTQTTLQADNELFFTMVAGAYYEIEATILYSSPVGGGTPDMKVTFDGPATFQGLHSVYNYVTTAEAATGASGAVSLPGTHGLGTSTAVRPAMIRAWATSSAGGSGASGLLFKWAQNTSSGNATRRHAGSVLRYRRIL